MIVPWQELDAQTLTNLLEEFVTRDGTDYGNQEISTVNKVDQVRAQLRDARAQLVFDGATETVTVMTREQLRELGI
ncbi:MAG: YheU family protein [Alcanivorax sp.]|nr:YheU family protein [Alcanivorax sp.]